ncbi:FecCD family ABC transporter permease [Paenibacillus barengoltzii]|uniref:FecCD family ABC transporter permease n=1 Tax=Paenibacillus barengoltzii TaxID=343517 RepID=UPI003879920F
MRSFKWKTWTFSGLALALMVVTVIISVLHGTKPIRYETAWEALVHFDEGNVDHQIIRTSRIPRAIGALLIGGLLAASGALMQGMTRNPLASPSIMGISDGSVFAITLCMAFLPGASNMAMVGYSLAGSTLGGVLVFGISRLLPGGSSPVMMAVLGTVMGTFLGGLSQALASYYQVSQNISFWYNARLHGISPDMIQLAIPFAAAGLILALFMARPMTALSLGEEIAAELGMNVKLIKSLTMLSVVIMTGISVAIAGKIAFVGLILPHITRFLVGPDYRRIVPLSALLGALFLGWCDLISRFLNPPFEVPIGVVTALFGVPYFLYLIKTRGGGRSE